MRAVLSPGEEEAELLGISSAQPGGGGGSTASPSLPLLQRLGFGDQKQREDLPLTHGAPSHKPCPAQPGS